MHEDYLNLLEKYDALSHYWFFQKGKEAEKKYELYFALFMQVALNFRKELELCLQSHLKKS